MMNAIFVSSICIHGFIILIFIEKKSMLDYFPTENIFPRDFRFSLPREFSFPQRIPGSGYSIQGQSTLWCCLPIVSSVCLFVSVLELFPASFYTPHISAVYGTLSGLTENFQQKWLQKFWFPCNSMILIEGQGHSNWYYIADAISVYHHAKLLRNHF